METHVGKSCCGGKKAGTPVTVTVSGSEPEAVVAVATSIDPICNMTVKVTEQAHQLSYNGKTFYFCCAGCKRKFNLAPERYLSGAPRKKSAANKAASFTCPMHPEVVSAKMGDCPDCGMPLEPTVATAVVDDTEERETTKHLKMSALFTIPLVLLSMSGMFAMHDMNMSSASHLVSCWLQLALATPVVAYAAQPFFKRGWNSIKTAKFNMFTLLALGIGIPYLSSLVSLLAVTFFATGNVAEHMVYFESAGVITTLAWLGQLLELRARTRSTSAVRELVALLPAEASVLLADGGEERVPLSELVDKCRVRVRPGERVPADGVIVQGETSIDESALTGESLPVERVVGDAVKAGSLNQSGMFIMETQEVGDNTTLAQVIELVGSAQRTRVPIQNLADKISAIFVPAVVIVAVASFVCWMFAGAGVTAALSFATAVFVIACPCALGLATPMSIVVALGRSAQAGVLFRQASAAQTLCAADTVVIDKTGTLTEGKPVVQNVVSFSRGFDEQTLLKLAASVAAGSEHVLAAAIREAAVNRQIDAVAVEKFEAQPGGGMAGTVDGVRVEVGTERYLRSCGAQFAPGAQAVERDAGTHSLIAINGEISGVVEFSDTVKGDAPHVVQSLRQAGLRVILASGDSEGAVRTAAVALGIDEFHARLTPQDKAALVASLRDQGKRVIMVGDGINDAPALAGADVGVAMSNGTDIAVNAADVVLLNGDLAGLLRGLKVSAAMVRNIRQNLFLAFAYNAVSVPLAAGLFASVAGFVLNPMVAALAMSLSSVAVIANALRLSRLEV